MYIVSKKLDIFLSMHIHHKEVECRCSSERCTYTLIHPETLGCFERLREEYGKPIKVNSAFRCQGHNKEVGGVPASFHTIGLAIDLAPYGIKNQKEFEYQLSRLKLLAREIFDTVIEYDTFIHCHNEEIIDERSTKESD